MYRVVFVILPLLGTPLLANAPLDFDRDVRPILAEHCFKCHDAGSQKGGLRLDQKPAMLEGGDSGEPAVVPGSSLQSHLFKLVTSEHPDEAMPPKGDRLKPEQVAVIQRWIDTGAHWVETTADKDPGGVIAVTGGMQVTEKDRQFWSFLPPQKSDPPATANAGWPRSRVDRFVLAKLEKAGLTPSADAPREVLIRRLTYDLTGLPPTPAEVDAFLADTSDDAYGQLVDRLLASPSFGERMASFWLPLARYGEDQAHLVGTDTSSFYPHAWKYRQWVIDAFNRDLPYDDFLVLQLAADKADQATPEELPALGFLGLGPKYYARGRLDVMAEEWEDRVDTVTRTTLGLTVACARCHDHKFDPIPTTDYYGLAGVFAGTAMVNKTAAGKVQKGNPKADEMDPEVLHIVEDDKPQDLNLFIRGNVESKGPVVPRRFLAVLSSSTPQPLADGSGRLDLAKAIVDPSNPLTARVMTNRVWGLLFGNPLVGTPSNFGRTGRAPSHPELLDDLAVRFMEGGWSIKSLVRELVMCSTYRQDSAYNADNAAADPANELLWRMNRRRLTVEQWRDTLLAVADRLDPESTGPSLELDNASNYRRTVYARISRLKLNDLLMQFDYPDANIHAERRAVTNTPVQKLFAMNSPFVLEMAKSLSSLLAADSGTDDAERVRQAYRLLFAREPSDDERDLALGDLSVSDDGSMTRWERYAQILLASNEALYVD